MDELEKARELMIERRRQLGLNDDGSRPGAPSLLGEALIKQIGTPTYTSGDDLAHDCPSCGVRVEPCYIEFVKRYVRGTCSVCPPPWAKEEEDRLARKAATDAEKRFAKYKAFFPSSELGERLIGATLDNFGERPGTEQVLRLARKYAAGLPRPNPCGLLIFGEAGNGKSHLAAGIAHAARSTGMAVASVHLPTWLRQIGTIESDEREFILAMAARADLLVMDDLGAGKLTASRVDWILYLIEERYRRQNPLVITSNLDMESIERVLNRSGEEGSYDGVRISDRLCEICTIGLNRGRSYRQEQATQRMVQQAKEAAGAV